MRDVCKVEGHWVPWFAWRPVRVVNSEADLVAPARWAWLCRVERRRAHYALLGEVITQHRRPTIRHHHHGAAHAMSFGSHVSRHA